MASLYPAPPAEITALLGRGTRFEGNLYFEGSVRIDGAFLGDIFSDHTLIVGDGADIVGNIIVATVIVRGGSIRGDITARSAVEIFAPARVTGNIHAPSLFIDKGVEFRGSCRMDAVPDAPPTATSDEP
jgi:cytoskeletal protein CcmA (bactofilin family)